MLEAVFFYLHFKTLNMISLLPAVYCQNIIVHQNMTEKILVETLQRAKHKQTWPFLCCHLELSLPGVLGLSKTHLQSLLSQSCGKGHLSLTSIPSGLSVREEIVTWAAQADAHLKPSQFNEAQHVDSEQISFVSLLSQNRFQALLDEIIQQEEREMEQVRVWGSVLALSFFLLLSCVHVFISYECQIPRLPLCLLSF